METSSLYFDPILSRLALSYPKACKFEELTELIMLVFYHDKTFTANMSAQRLHQAKILDALIQMHEKGYIVLDEDADQSCITLKGLIKINNTALRN